MSSEGNPMLLLATSLLACAPESPPPTEAEWRFEQQGPPAAAVADALIALLPGVMELNALPAVEAYEALSGNMEPTCPDRYEEPGSVHWSGRCTTTSGVVYSGAAFWYNFGLAELPEERWGGIADELPEDVPLSGREVFGQIDIVHPELGDFRCSGSAGVLAADDRDTRIEVSRTEGDCAYSLAPASSWLSGNPRPSLVLRREWHQDELVDVRVEGAVSGLEGEVTALKMRLYGNTDAGPDKCKVSGWVKGRDDQGGWTLLWLDHGAGPGCSGELVSIGEGRFALDFEPLTAREPWSF